MFTLILPLSIIKNVILQIGQILVWVIKFFDYKAGTSNMILTKQNIAEWPKNLIRSLKAFSKFVLNIEITVKWWSSPLLPQIDIATWQLMEHLLSGGKLKNDAGNFLLQLRQPKYCFIFLVNISRFRRWITLQFVGGVI